MKKFFFSLMVMMAMLVSMSLSARSSSDDESNDNGGGVTNTNTLVGTWSRDYYTGDGAKSKEVYTFSNNGSGTYRNAYQSATFSYVAANGYIAAKIRYSDSSTIIEDVWSYSIAEKTLYLNGNQYVKQ